MNEGTERCVLDAVIEGVPSPRAADASEIWPRELLAIWKPVELPASSDGSDPRRAWTIRDPESDLELSVIWAPGPGDPLEASAALEAESADAAGVSLPPSALPPSAGWLLFGHAPRRGSRAEDLQRVFELALRMAERLGLKLFDPVLGETYETEDWAYRLTEPFHPRDYVATHWVRSDATRVSWVHTHGMERFGLPDVEAFDVPEEHGEAVVAFLHEAAASWIREDAPAPAAAPRRVDGVKVRVLEPSAARARLEGYGADAWEGHGGPALTILPAGDWGHALEGWRPSSVRRSPGLVDRLCAITGEILPQVRRRFEATGADVKVKARFALPPPRSAGTPSFESMWVHVEAWEKDRIRGRLANQPEIRSDLACGAPVEVNADEVWDVLVVKDGRPYRGVSLRRWLRQE